MQELKQTQVRTDPNLMLSRAAAAAAAKRTCRICRICGAAVTAETCDIRTTKTDAGTERSYKVCPVCGGAADGSVVVKRGIHDESMSIFELFGKSAAAEAAEARRKNGF